MPGGRHKGREIFFRILFETEISGEDPLEALELALGRYRLTEDGRDHAIRLCRIWIDRRNDVDALLRKRLANWDLTRLSSVVRAVLRMATVELMGAPEVPARVVLDQAVELSKEYGEDGADAFVNGVLDSVGGELRPEEIESRGEAE